MRALYAYRLRRSFQPGGRRHMSGAKSDISAADGQLITAEAVLWKGTPYALIGPASEKGTGADCSGSTQKIYANAGFQYVYQMASALAGYAASSGLFRELGASEAWQDGDILSWTNHMAIYCTFTKDPGNA